MTLIEVLVASVLLGIGVAGLISAATLGLRNQQRVDQRTVALYLAQEMLAQAEAVGPHLYVLSEPTQGVERREGINYAWTLDIAPQVEAVGELFSVQIAVEWDAPGGGGEIEMETWLNDYRAAAHLRSESQESNNPNPTADR